MQSLVLRIEKLGATIRKKDNSLKKVDSDHVKTNAQQEMIATGGLNNLTVNGFAEHEKKTLKK